MVEKANRNKIMASRLPFIENLEHKTRSEYTESNILYALIHYS